MLEIVGMLLHYYQRLRGGDPAVAPGIGIEGEQHTFLKRRFVSASRLMEGHFHAAFDALAYVLGQSEISAARSTAENSAVRDATGEALHDLTEQIQYIREFLRQSGEADRSRVPLPRVLEALPQTFEGMTHLLQDRKNIAVRVKAGPRYPRTQQIATEDVYDQLYPVILRVMEEAICSGEIIVTAAAAHGSDAVRIECRSECIGHTSLARIVQDINDAPGELDRDNECLLVDLERTHWIFETGETPMQRAWFVLDRAPSLPPAQEPSSKIRREPEVG
jgi:hypothetical protein